MENIFMDKLFQKLTRKKQLLVMHILKQKRHFQFRNIYRKLLIMSIGEVWRIILKNLDLIIINHLQLLKGMEKLPDKKIFIKQYHFKKIVLFLLTFIICRTGTSPLTIRNTFHSYLTS